MKGIGSVVQVVGFKFEDLRLKVQEYGLVSLGFQVQGAGLRAGRMWGAGYLSKGTPRRGVAVKGRVEGRHGVHARVPRLLLDARTRRGVRRTPVDLERPRGLVSPERGREQLQEGGVERRGEVRACRSGRGGDDHGSVDRLSRHLYETIRE